MTTLPGDAEETPPVENSTPLSNDAPKDTPEPKKLGRPALSDDMKVQAARHPIRLRLDQWDNLQNLAVELNIRSPSGPRIGSLSWRSLITYLADHTGMLRLAILLVERYGQETLEALLAGDLVMVKKSDEPTDTES